MSTQESKRKKELAGFQQVIDYRFDDLSLLDTALTHSSYTANRNEVLEHNERLEFLGDSILSMIVSQYIFKSCKEMAEGQLTRVRANIVCEQSLHEAAEKIKLGKYLAISKGEELTGGRTRPSILADAFEALIAAIYLDGGLSKAKTFVLDILKGTIQQAIQNKIISDYKSFIQEHIQKNSQGKISYKLLSEEGPDHSKTFDMAIMLDDTILGTGSGNSKKEAQQAAAKDAIEKLGLENE
ncbi:MAG: ribonuclease III [Clostridiales bacterium GWB2_37_7]|nr:MAG: ribonuclease III [Clostridiales bacterium GWB2_37_7]